MDSKLFYGLLLSGCTGFISVVVGLATWAVKGYIASVVNGLDKRLERFENKIDGITASQTQCRVEVTSRLSALESELKGQ